MERYITVELGDCKAVILDIEDFKALVRATENAEDARDADESQCRRATGEEMIDYRRAREV